MDDSPSSDTGSVAAPQADSSRGPRRSARFWVVVAVLGVIVLACAVPVWFTATPGQCASCHEMKPYYDSWQASSHREAASNCLYCHARPGVLNLLSYEAGFYGEMFAHVAGAPVTSITGNTPSVASCGRPECHSLNRETSNSGDIKINHRLHVTQANVPCTRCHAGAVHTGVGGRRKLPPLSLCKACHADKMSQCGYCHAEQHTGAPPAGH